jgi:hypothetical protein
MCADISVEFVRPGKKVVTGEQNSAFDFHTAINAKALNWVEVSGWFQELTEVEGGPQLVWTCWLRENSCPYR